MFCSQMLRRTLLSTARHFRVASRGLPIINTALFAGSSFSFWITTSYSLCIRHCFKMSTNRLKINYMIEIKKWRNGPKNTFITKLLLNSTFLFGLFLAICYFNSEFFIWALIQHYHCACSYSDLIIMSALRSWQEVQYIGIGEALIF